MKAMPKTVSIKYNIIVRRKENINILRTINSLLTGTLSKMS